MAFYADPTTDPKRSFRFLFSLPSQSVANSLQAYYVKEVKKPTFQMEGGPQIKYIQHAFKYPGRVVWQDVTVTVVDPGGSDDAGAALYNMLAKSGYSVPTDAPFEGTLEESISKRKALDALGQPRLTQIDSEGFPIEEWTMHNAFVSSVDFGTVSYDSDDIVNVQLTIMYDYATLAIPNGRVVDPRVRTK
ncbi:MAG: hypothetical protein CML17_10880 [Pusillimonas sp.]|jgi:hypothetical protein|nr:hypothetical protein [Pusillimonas sp.]|tara:strand:- start:134 stop:703 length:570 start_codon:yes stop_codon:yes gene_type:complete